MPDFNKTIALFAASVWALTASAPDQALATAPAHDAGSDVKSFVRRDRRSVPLARRPEGSRDAGSTSRTSTGGVPARLPGRDAIKQR
jgi:hypothetical protein